MKIRKLKIKNYKVFDDVEFDFTDLAGKTVDTVVLAGQNGCGKTTVLELLKQVFSHNFSTHFFEQTEVTFEFELNKKEINSITSRLISQNPIWSSINRNDWAFTSKGDDATSLQYFVDLLEVTGITENTIVYFPINELGHANYAGERVTVLKMSSRINELKEQALRQIRDEIFKNRNKPPKDIIEHQIQNITRSLEGMGLNTRLIDLESEELVFESANGQRIYFEQLSHGEQHLYFRSIFLNQLDVKDGIIMIDEPEAAFHPTWQQKIAQLYCNAGENNQVFMATHSPHIMASVPPECLFMLHIDESTRKIRVINAAKEGKYSQGLEPHRILKEIMQVDTLRDYETQRHIDRLTALLTPEEFEGQEAQALAEELTRQLGRQDPFIIRLEHQLLLLRRKKESPAPIA